MEIIIYIYIDIIIIISEIYFYNIFQNLIPIIYNFYIYYIFSIYPIQEFNLYGFANVTHI